MCVSMLVKLEQETLCQKLGPRTLIRQETVINNSTSYKEHRIKLWMFLGVYLVYLYCLNIFCNMVEDLRDVFLHVSSEACGEFS